MFFIVEVSSAASTPLERLGGRLFQQVENPAPVRGGLASGIDETGNASGDGPGPGAAFADFSTLESIAGGDHGRLSRGGDENNEQGDVSSTFFQLELGDHLSNSLIELATVIRGDCHARFRFKDQPGPFIEGAEDLVDQLGCRS